MHPHTTRRLRSGTMAELARFSSEPFVKLLTMPLSRYIPPKLNTERSNIENSQNTTLFLISCFQYTLSGIVLSIGPPFRRSMAQNCTLHILQANIEVAHRSLVPFVVTIVAAFLFSTYMLLDPGTGLAKFMQLTYLSLNFKIFIFILVAGGFACSWVAERRVFLWLARIIGKTHDRIWPQRRKKRKEYKTLQEKMRI